MGKPLQVGDSWLGHFDHPDGTRRVGMLRRTDRSIEIHFPEEGDIGALFPLMSRSSDPQAISGIIQFSGTSGRATLLGLTALPAGWASNDEGLSSLTAIHAEAAVCESRRGVDYTTIAAMRSRVEGLEGFLRVQTIESGPQQNGGFEIRTTGSVEEEILPGGVLVWRTGSTAHSSTDGTHRIQEYVELVSRCDDPSDWLGWHLPLHQSIADLMTLLNWRPCHVYDITVSHPDAFRADGHEMWSPMELASAGQRPPYRVQDAALPLVTRSEMGTDGMRRWMRLWSDWNRQIKVMCRLPFLRSAFLEAQFSQMGIGLEGIGYRLALESGKSKRRAKDMNLLDRILLIRKALGPTGARIDRGVPTAIVNAYNGIKHANRQLPEPTELQWLLPWGETIFQLWLVLRLTDSHELVEAIANDVLPA